MVFLTAFVVNRVFKRLFGCGAPGHNVDQYLDARFTQVLRGEEDLRELLDDDDDEDEDFTLDWDELMGPNPFGQGTSSHTLLCFCTAFHIAAHQGPTFSTAVLCLQHAQAHLWQHSRISDSSCIPA